MDDISRGTAMQLEDIFYVLREQDMITVYDGNNANSRHQPQASIEHGRNRCRVRLWSRTSGRCCCPSRAATAQTWQASSASATASCGRLAFVQGPRQERSRISTA